MSNPIQQLEGQEQAADRSQTKDTARRIAHMIAEGMQGGNTQQQTQQTQVDTTQVQAQETQEVQQQQTQEQVDQTQQQVDQTQQTQQEVVETAPELAEIDKLLSDNGIDLGVTAAEVPAEMLPVFERMVETAVEIRRSAEQERMAAAEAVEQVREFAEQLKTNPERLLLTLAVSNSEAFTRAVEAFTEMQQDPRVKDLVIRELQSEARLREAERREKLYGDDARRVKAQRVINAAKIATRKHNVPFGLAEKVVASAVVANGGDLDPSEVEGIVADLANDLKGRLPARPQRTASAQKLQQQRQAPTGEVAGSAAAPAQQQQGGPSKGLEITTPHGRLRKIITDALGRTRPQQQ